MKCHITCVNGMGGTAFKAQEKISAIASTLGFDEWGIYSIPEDCDREAELSRRLDGVIANLRNGDLVFIQYPTWTFYHYERWLLQKIRGYRGTRIIILVHDLRSAFTAEGSRGLEEEIDLFNRADLLILPSPNMETYLRANGLTNRNIQYQLLFDYPVSTELPKPGFQRVIHFSGDPYRFEFVQSWQYRTPLRLYCDGKLPDLSGTNVQYQGYMLDTALMLSYTGGGFGLVWSDDVRKHYYDMVLPYKLTTFLAAGIPAILQKGLTPNSWLVANGLGVEFDTLEAADNFVQSISEDHYREMTERVGAFTHLIREGYFTKKMLVDAVMRVTLDHGLPGVMADRI